MDAHRLSVALLIGIAGLLATFGPTYAAGNSIRPTASDWQQHDTAVYVVSTLNLLHTRHGQPVAQVFAHRLGVTRYDVYGDLNSKDLYFIELKRASGSLAAVFGYRMGWIRPVAVLFTNHVLRAAKATPDVAEAYRSDNKQLIGTFQSTLPTN